MNWEPLAPVPAGAEAEPEAAPEAEPEAAPEAELVPAEATPLDEAVA